MVVDWQWPNVPQEAREILNKDGYKEMKTGIFVSEEDAYDYAMERISQDEDLKREFKEMLVEWFYSGDWVRENGRETHT